MNLEILASPVQFLSRVLDISPYRERLDADQAWWNEEGKRISDSIDHLGTPWLQMFDQLGARVDRIFLPSEYEKMLRRGYASGVLWRAFEEESLIPSYALIYNTSFYDPGVCCPYTVSLATAIAVRKYGSHDLQARFLARLLAKEGLNSQGATWMTEIGGGSDLGAAVETIAKLVDGRYVLNGEKYFASNVGAELAVVAARPEKAPRNVRGLALFLVPRYRRDGQLNYFIRRLKDKIATRSVPTGEVELRESEAYLLGSLDRGIYLILEVLNISRVANSVASIALAQRAMAEALEFAGHRVAFGRKILDHPLLRRQFEENLGSLCGGLALAWEAVKLLDDVWREEPAYSERYHLFRLVAHMAKYWTAELAVRTAKWGMEIHGGLGVLGEYRAERWLREAMIIAIWEGTSHRQILDGLEVIERKCAHRLLFKRLEALAPAATLQEVESFVESYVNLPGNEKEAGAEAVFRRLAEFTADTLKTGVQW
jgi:alkylation response protein AidB-like acyl-CoA dehydrogenase